MTICLNMIVKDEAHVIERALDSVVDFVDMVVISDTGSTDTTQAVVLQWAVEHPDIRVEWHQTEWFNFAHNRNVALDVACGLLDDEDLILFLDADDVLVTDEDSPHQVEYLRVQGRRTKEPTDAFNLSVEYGDTRYHRPALIRAGSPWVWKGTVHEYLHLEDARLDSLVTPRIQVIGGGARSQQPDKFLADAALLEEVIQKSDEVDPRDVFYLAQSYRDAGKDRHALSNYSWRYELGGWEQERFYAAYQCAVLRLRIERTHAITLEWLDRAHEIDPSRAEPLWLAAQTLRLAGKPHTALMYAQAAVSDRIDPSPEALFVEQDVYDWRRWDELAMCVASSGVSDDSLKVMANAAAQRAMIACPDDSPDLERLAANVGWWAAQ